MQDYRPSHAHRFAWRLVRALMMAATVLFAAAPVQGAKPWPALRVIRSVHYRVHSDVDPALHADLAHRLDRMYDEYARRLADFYDPRSGEIFDVYIFARSEDYAAFIDGRHPNTGGIFIPERNLLAAHLGRQGLDALRRTLQHEAFHQFAQQAIGPNVPVWLNEGLAQFFEEGIWTGDRYCIGQVPPRRLRQLHDDLRLGRLIDFETLMGLSHEQWAGNLARDADQGATQYNQAWAMVHFLVHGRNGEDAYRTRLVEMLRLLEGGTSPRMAFTSAYSSNITGFRDRFEEFVRTLSVTPEASMVERQEVLADFLVALHSKGVRATDAEDFRQTVMANRLRLKYGVGRLEWETDPDPSVYFTNLAGQLLDGDSLYLEPRAGRPLPDIVCRYGKSVQFRTRFYDTRTGIQHELMPETAKQ